MISHKKSGEKKTMFPIKYPWIYMIRIYISYLTYENQIKWNESNYIPFIYLLMNLIIFQEMEVLIANTMVWLMNSLAQRRRWQAQTWKVGSPNYLIKPPVVRFVVESSNILQTLLMVKIRSNTRFVITTVSSFIFSCHYALFKARSLL